MQLLSVESYLSVGPTLLVVVWGKETEREELEMRVCCTAAVVGILADKVCTVRRTVVTT